MAPDINPIDYRLNPSKKELPGPEVLTRGNRIAKVLSENNFHLPIEMRLTQNKISSMLRQQGFKLTPQRRAVLRAIALNHEHFTPGDIYNRVRQESPDIGLVTVYRTLHILAQLGLICEVHTGGSRQSFIMRRPSEHHHHLICSHCGTVVDFAHCDLTELEHRLSRETGYKIESHLLEIMGCCRSCRGKV